MIDGNLYNMMDAPGHVEYSAELSVTYPMADGAVVVCNGSGGGVASTTIRQCKDLHDWGITPILFCNRLDVSLLVTKKEADEIKDDVFQLVEEYNNSFQTIGSNTSVSPQKGSVLFGCLAQGWAFTIPQMA